MWGFIVIMHSLQVTACRFRKRKAGFEVETSEETEPPEKQCSASRHSWLGYGLHL